jgi:hypothetical protein
MEYLVCCVAFDVCRTCFTLRLEATGVVVKVDTVEAAVAVGTATVICIGSFDGNRRRTNICTEAFLLSSTENSAARIAAGRVKFGLASMYCNVFLTRGSPWFPILDMLGV